LTIAGVISCVAMVPPFLTGGPIPIAHWPYLPLAVRWFIIMIAVDLYASRLASVYEELAVSLPTSTPTAAAVPALAEEGRRGNGHRVDDSIEHAADGLDNANQLHALHLRCLSLTKRSFDGLTLFGIALNPSTVIQTVTLVFSALYLAFQ